MNFKRFFISAAFGIFAIKAASLLYGAVESPIVHLKNAQELDTFLKANPLAVVEFHDLNCPVCQAFKRKGIYNETALALPHIKFAMVSVQEGSGLHGEYKIQNYPTFMFWRNAKKISYDDKGKPTDRYAGYVPNPMFTRKITDIFAQAELEAQKKQATNPEVE